MQRLLARDIMSSPVVTVSPEQNVAAIAHEMGRHRVSGLCVVDDDRDLIGIVTEGDLVRKEMGIGGQPELSYRRGDWDRRLEAARAKDLMTSELVTAGPHTSVRDVACMMHQQEVNRVPIVDDGKLVGIVTRADIVALFDRAEHALLADVRRVLTDDLLLDPDAFEIAIDDGVVRLKGAVRDPRDIRLVEVFLEQVDGVTGIDTSGLAAASTA